GWCFVLPRPDGWAAATELDHPGPYNRLIADHTRREPTMAVAPFALALVPTLLLLGLVGAYQVKQPRARALWAAFALGALVTVPVWFVEAAVEDPASGLPGPYQRAFAQQVLGAALVEEVALFLVLLGVYALFRGSVLTRPVDVVVVAVSGAVGFTTVE